MKLISETSAIARLDAIREDHRQAIARYEVKARDCSTCDVQGSCCLDAHFVNVRITRLEAVAIKKALDTFPDEIRKMSRKRIDAAAEEILTKGVSADHEYTFACPLFEKGIGCLVHDQAKPLPCISHACYENRSDLPPESLLDENLAKIERLNRAAYGSEAAFLPIPVALTPTRPTF